MSLRGILRRPKADARSTASDRPSRRRIPVPRHIVAAAILALPVLGAVPMLVADLGSGDEPLPGIAGEELGVSAGVQAPDARGRFTQGAPVLPDACPEQGELFDQLGGPSGPRAVAHRAGGVAIDDPTVLAEAPVPRLLETGFAAAEPTIGVSRSGGIYTVGVECEAPPEGNQYLVAPVLRSLDGGRSWKDISPRAPDGTHGHGATLDPYVYLDKATERLFTTDIVGPGSCSPFSGRDVREGGWQTSVVCGLSDHQNVFTGPPVSSETSGYPNVIYYCAISEGALAGETSKAAACAKSLDGGTTFVRTGEPAYVVDPADAAADPRGCDGTLGPGFADAAGTVYVPKGYCGQPFLSISEDEGASWRRVQVAEIGMNTDFDFNGHEAAVAVDSAGTIYYTWIARDRLPYLAVSRDGGQTFGEPLMVGPPGIREASLPAIDVGGEGKIALVYMGSMNSPGPPFNEDPDADYENVTFNGYMTVSADAAAPDPTFFTASVNDPADPLVKGTCGALRCQHEFDFLDVVIAPDGTPYASLVDGYTADSQDGAFPFGAGIVGQLVDGPELADPSLIGPDAVIGPEAMIGSDAIKCRAKSTGIVGSNGPDKLVGTPGDDVIFAGAGGDDVRSRGGSDLICGRGGADSLKGGPGRDLVIGNGGRDRLGGNGGRDRLAGRKGGDLLRGGTRGDRLGGGRGRDRLRGLGGDDRLFGGKGRDLLRGGAGSDRCDGAAGGAELGCER